MSKYTSLQQHLETLNQQEIPLSFSEIEKIISASLPSSARRYRPWWSNNPFNNVMTHAWLKAGYRTAQVDMEGEKLIFRKDKASMSGVKLGNRVFFGALKGFITLSDNVDLTKPVMPEWDDIAQSKLEKQK
ncbi:MAG: DUF7662 domain-containing protein [Parvibaculales bacterium]